MQHLKGFYRATASLAVLALLSFPSASAAQVYRCVDAAGKVTFSDQGCADGHSSSAIDVAPPTPSTAPSTASSGRNEAGAALLAFGSPSSAVRSPCPDGEN